MEIQGHWFLDHSGRRLMLRGVNVSGASKVPSVPDGATYRKERFFEHRTVSFVGRPFPLDEADEHFKRLKHWGLTTLRFLITWEAIEHAGPGQYDEAYLDYLEKVVAKAGEYGLQLFIDPHQDVWSRFSGGDGAPGWTLEAVGFELENLHPSGAAVVHALMGENYPRMIWGTNSYKLASATMFTLFFAGDVFAPKTRIDGELVQEFLQSHYIEAIQQVALRLKGFSHVIGYDTLNEPSDGWIGFDDVRVQDPLYQLGASPTPYQSMLLGDGLPTEVDFYEIKGLGVRKTGTRLLNPEGLRAWQDDRAGVWRQNGVWDYGEDGLPEVHHPDHFARVNGKAVDFSNHFLRPFVNRFGKAIREVDRPSHIFIESVPHKGMPDWTEEDIPNVVNASHWYDDVTLITKRFRWYATMDLATGRLALGPWRIRSLFEQVLREMKEMSNEKFGDIPLLIGEFGIPFDMHSRKAYSTGNYHKQILALDASFQALEANLLHGTLWNYTPDNTNAHGDLWNDEDLSIFSRDQQDDSQDINSGARAPEAFIRPYPIATAGTPLKLRFRLRRARFEFVFRGDPEVEEPTVIYIPEFHYGKGIIITVSDGRYEYSSDEQRLNYWPESPKGEHTIRFRRK
ncbi:MAG: cellulase family glycosylhydrolase [Brevefilum sp.]